MSIKLLHSPNYPDINCPHCGTGYNVYISMDMREHEVQGNKVGNCKECDKSFKYRIDVNFWQPENERIRYSYVSKAFTSEERELLIGGLYTAQSDARRTMASFVMAGIEDGTGGQVEALQALVKRYEELIEKLR